MSTLALTTTCVSFCVAAYRNLTHQRCCAILCFLARMTRGYSHRQSVPRFLHAASRTHLLHSQHQHCSLEAPYLGNTIFRAKGHRALCVVLTGQTHVCLDMGRGKSTDGVRPLAPLRPSSAISRSLAQTRSIHCLRTTAIATSCHSIRQQLARITITLARYPYPGSRGAGGYDEFPTPAAPRPQWVVWKL